MPQGPNPLIKPFVVLALPGMYLFYKYNQYKRKRKENAKRRLTERELQHLNNKIDKLLSKLEENEPELATCQEEECVICIHAKATMQTSPCGHQVVCRKCFVKTIQIAVSQRLLPLRCVICRAKILRLKTGSILPSSASGYSVNSRSSSVPQSDSLYSVSSGNSTISSTSCSSSESASGPCCCQKGQCLGAYPRQPTTGALKRSQQHAMKMKLQDYKCNKGAPVNRLPPIKEISLASSPTHNGPPPASTRIRCAQKILTQLESGGGGGGNKKGTAFKYKYEKLSQCDDENDSNEFELKEKRNNCTTWWRNDKKRKNAKCQESNDNKKNEIAERHNMLELKDKGKSNKNGSGKGYKNDVKDKKL